VRRAHYLLLALAACKKHPGPIAGVQEIPLDSPPGVSDLALDDRGTLWAIPERDRVLLEITWPDVTVVRHPLDGVPPGLDTESLTWLAPGRFAIGTEGQDTASASVLSVEQRGERYAVTGERVLTDAELGLQLSKNHGAEAICGRGDDVVVGIESVARLPGGGRWAPIVRLHAGAFVSLTRLHLTTETGKLSAMTCTLAADGSGHAYAIERHYGVHRILELALPAAGGDVVPTLVRDLDPLFHGAYNLEGLVRLPDGRFVLVNDNQSATVDGPTELFVLAP
jgi:hypothetical protein